MSMYTERTRLHRALHLFALVLATGIRRCIRTWERSIYPRRPAPDIPTEHSN